MSTPRTPAEVAALRALAAAGLNHRRALCRGDSAALERAAEEIERAEVLLEVARAAAPRSMPRAA